MFYAMKASDNVDLLRALPTEIVVQNNEVRMSSIRPTHEELAQACSKPTNAEPKSLFY